MKICHFKKDNQIRLGILIIDQIIDVALTQLGKNNETIPHLLSDFLKKYQGESLTKLREITQIFDQLRHKEKIDYIELSDIKLDRPLDDINCYRDFYIHEKHVKTGFEKRGEKIPEAWYEMPVYYKGATSGFIGPEQEIMWPRFTKKLDYELEIAAVIGKDGFNITEENAFEHIFGFTILNDVSARDIQKKEMSCRLGPAKSKDFCSVIGPVITTADEFSFKEPSLKMKAYINDELWSEGLSSDGHFTWAQIIAHTSNEEWLKATDLLGSGTVGTGCGLELDKWIKPGDTVKLEIEKIGILENKVGAIRK